MSNTDGDEPRDAGLKISNKWETDEDFTDGVKDAVLSIRERNKWGPRNRDRIVFRASELGNVAAFRDHKGEPGGCARKVFYSFYEEEYPARDFDAETLLNFSKGDESEERFTSYLDELGWEYETQVKLGAWSTDEDAPEYARADPRFPDRSGGLVRGKLDFLVEHPRFGKIPLEWKSCSSFVFRMVKKSGAKGDNTLQAQFYGREAETEYCAIGYENKESGNILILYAKVNNELIEAVLDRAKLLREQIENGEMPDMPEGVRAPERDPHRWYPKWADAYYDRVWPCYAYATKKKMVHACPYFEHCWGELPEEPDEPEKARQKKSKGKTITFES